MDVPFEPALRYGRDRLRWCRRRLARLDALDDGAGLLAGLLYGKLIAETDGFPSLFATLLDDHREGDRPARRDA
jgi:hypothetical protein